MRYGVLFLLAISVLVAEPVPSIGSTYPQGPDSLSPDTAKSVVNPVAAESAPSVGEQEIAGDSTKSPKVLKPVPPETKPTPTISTELQGSDTLNIMPEELVTTYEGGTRRVKIERTVFRRETPVVYDPAGRRDPFRALLVDEKKEGEIETDLLRLENAVLTGVVWSDGQYLAMVKDKDGRNFFLREGDPVFQGHVVSVSQNQAVFEVSDFGDYQRYTLKVKG